MREIRQSGSEGGEAGNLTGLPYPYQFLFGQLIGLIGALTAIPSRAPHLVPHPCCVDSLGATGRLPASAGIGHSTG